MLHCIPSLSVPVCKLLSSTEHAQAWTLYLKKCETTQIQFSVNHKDSVAFNFTWRGVRQPKRSNKAANYRSYVMTLWSLEII